jgi:hypothetical protein
MSLDFPFVRLAVTITVFTTILEQNRSNSCQISAKRSEVNVKNTFTSHIDKKKLSNKDQDIFLLMSKTNKKK